MKLIRYDCFEIEYDEKDQDDIAFVVLELQKEYKDIMNFFDLDHFDKKIQIKFWNNIEEYRTFFNERLKKYHQKVQSWEVGRSTNNEKEDRIDLLNLNERKKCQGHQQDTIEDLAKVLLHEFTHTCHFAYNGKKETMTWYAEALATNLSHQFDTLEFDSSLDEIKKGTAYYNNYYCMGKYLIDHCDKSYILELAKNKKLLEQDTDNIYQETLKYVENQNRKQK